MSDLEPQLVFLIADQQHPQRLSAGGRALEAERRGLEEQLLSPEVKTKKP